MEAKAFADLYEPVIPPNTGSDLDELLAPSRDWANRFADMAHARLSGQTLNGNEVNDNLGRYAQWLSHHFNPLQAQLGKTPDQNKALHGLSEFNFHRLNVGMLPMWHSLLHGRQPDPKEHRKDTYFARDMVAQVGFQLYRGREIAASIQKGHSYFSEENRRKRQVMEGMLHEHDTAVVLLNAVKDNPNLTVVPAPSGFEHGRQGKYNVDFLVADLGGFAVGVQAKLTVKQEDYERYDPDAVVLVCGNTDFSSTAAKRTVKGKSAVRKVAWPGMICGHVTTNTPLHGTFLAGASQSSSPQAYRRVVAERAKDKAIMGSIKPNLRDVTKIVGQRVIAKLYDA